MVLTRDLTNAPPPPPPPTDAKSPGRLATLMGPASPSSAERAEKPTDLMMTMSFSPPRHGAKLDKKVPVVRRVEFAEAVKKPAEAKPPAAAPPASPEAVIDLDAARSEAERLERLAESAKKASLCESPAPWRLQPKRDALTPRDAESRESKRHVAALRLQTLLHHRRAEKARAKTVLLEKLQAARSRFEAASPHLSATPARPARPLRRPEDGAAAVAALSDARRALAEANKRADVAEADASADRRRAAAAEARAGALEKAAAAAPPGTPAAARKSKQAKLEEAAAAAARERDAAAAEAAALRREAADADALRRELADAREAAAAAQREAAAAAEVRETFLAAERARADAAEAQVEGAERAAARAKAETASMVETTEAAEGRVRRAEAAEAAARGELAKAAASFDGDRKLWDGVRRRLHNRVVELQGNIRVFVRVRPALAVGANGSGTTAGGLTCPAAPAGSSADAVEVAEQVAPGGPPRKARTFKFAYDRVLDGAADQVAVFREVRPFVQSALDGYKVCVFAYGQTGSGKTHTMLGGGGPATSAAPGADAGLLQRSLHLVFDGVEQLKATQGWTFELSVEMLEIYLDKVYDLLGDGGEPQPRAVRDTGEAIAVDGLTRVNVSCAEEADLVLAAARKRRHTSATKSNDHSSRSHCLFALHVHGASGDGREVRRGCLNLVDLAGSERLAASGSNDDPKLLKEAQFINSSLAALGNTISALTSGDRAHVPFRDSKLTFLLQPCLGGDAKTLAIFNLAPELQHHKETLCTLRFGQKVTKCAPKNVCAKCGSRAAA